LRRSTETAADSAAALRTPGSAAEGTAYLISKRGTLASRWKTRKRQSAGELRPLTTESLHLKSLIRAATTPRRSTAQESSKARQSLTNQRRNQSKRSQMTRSSPTRGWIRSSLKARRRRTKKKKLSQSSHPRLRGSSTIDLRRNSSHMRAESESSASTSCLSWPPYMAARKSRSISV